MVLGDLGAKIGAALSKLNTASLVDENVLKAVLQDIARALMQADVNVRLVKQIRDNIKRIVDFEELASGTNKAKIIQDAVFSELVGMLDPGREPFKLRRGRSNVVMFVGLQGSGKTTTIAKYAHYYNRKGWKTAMVCADTFRAGAFDQLKQNAVKARVNFYGSYTESDPVKIAEDGVRQFRKDKYELILVDTSGRHKQEADLFTEMEQVRDSVRPDEIIFVMDATIGQAVEEQAQAFRDAVDVGSVIVTKLDGHARGGGALSAVAATESPITFIGTGEHFDALEPFSAESFVSRMMGRGDIKGLMRGVKEAGMLENQDELLKKMKKGIFTLRDLYEQFQNILKMGNLSSVLSMIPGLGNMLANADKNGDATKNLQRFLTIMDSMNGDELDCLSPMDAGRIRRVARGSGNSEFAVRQVLQAHKQFEKMIGKMGKTGLLKNENQLSTQMARNPNMAIQQMARSLDPRMLQQVGGLQGVQKMMRGLSGMGEAGGIDPQQMAEMARMFGGGGAGAMMGGGKPRAGRRGRRR